MGSMAIEPSMSDSSVSTPEPPASPIQNHSQTHAPRNTPAAKRSSTDAGLKQNGGLRAAKSVKRRASKACQCCRARKVRCNVVEHGAPCTNCRLDEVECIVSESKRKKKWTSVPDVSAQVASETTIPGLKPATSVGAAPFPMSAAPPYEPLRRMSEHVPHSLYADLGRDFGIGVGEIRHSAFTAAAAASGGALSLQQRLNMQSTHFPISASNSYGVRIPSPSTPGCSLPSFIKPLSSRIGSEDVAFLERKGALTIPPAALRDELLRSYAEYVHPYMPLLNVQELVTAIDRNDGGQQIGLLLFQAIMFAGVATAEIQHLRRAGYTSRRDARRDFFQKTRLLYDFDIELDRVSLIQALLLMTYWYETPDDLKDSHHWMGIAVSLAHSIGLHRGQEPSPNSSQQEISRRRLWRRIWWSTYMRDRLIALGMRRPTRICNSDFDVRMLTLDDFEIQDLPVLAEAVPSCVPARCRVVRDADTQRRLAIMCIEKIRLCVAMSHVLSVQYSVLHNNGSSSEESGSIRTTMMLTAKQIEPGADELRACDRELQAWHDNLAEEARYVTPSWADIAAGDAGLVLNRSLLHMMYYATLSALHRPQVLPAPTSASPAPASSEMIELARRSVRLAASEITEIANALDRLSLVRRLPTTGVTVLLPAIIIHLLDIKAPDEATRRASLKGFCECMQIMAKLRDIYAAADYSTAFLEAAIRKADISLPQRSDEVRDPRNVITSTQGLFDAGRRMHLVQTPASVSGTLTPPPDDAKSVLFASLPVDKINDGNGAFQDEDEDEDDDDADEDAAGDVHLARTLNNYLTSSPPDSNGVSGDVLQHHHFQHHQPEYEPDFDSLINLDAAGEVWSMDDSAYAAMQGESGGFAMDVDWMKGIQQEEGMAGLSAQDFVAQA